MIMRKCGLILSLILLLLALVGCGDDNIDLFDGCNEPLAEKPVIYLYPEEKTDVSVCLDVNGAITSSYPAYGSGWRVTAESDGKLTDQKTGREYYCLFWEGKINAEYDMSRGFVVPGVETEAFLEESLRSLGLTDREADEFIIYWLPRMENNPYNLISFQESAYADNAVLTVDPMPDTVIRVFMAWSPLDEPIEIETQKLESAPRVGFTVVEWGGAEVK